MLKNIIQSSTGKERNGNNDSLRSMKLEYARRWKALLKGFVSGCVRVTLQERP